MNLAGIDTSVFNVHSTRAASSTKVSDQGVPLEEIPAYDRLVRSIYFSEVL